MQRETIKPFPQATEIERLKLQDIVDRIDAVTKPPAMQPPDYGEAQRGAINSIADHLTRETCGKIADLREQLDALQESVLRAAADAQHQLTELVSVCAGVDDEMRHMRKVVEDIAHRVAPPKTV